MFEHPIKRAGLSMNRIIFSNTQMIVPCLPNQDTLAMRFGVGYRIKHFENGKEISRKDVTSKDLDELFPSRK